jgi:hypothetical protein
VNRLSSAKTFYFIDKQLYEEEFAKSEIRIVSTLISFSCKCSNDESNTIRLKVCKVTSASLSRLACD